MHRLVASRSELQLTTNAATRPDVIHIYIQYIVGEHFFLSLTIILVCLEIALNSKKLSKHSASVLVARNAMYNKYPLKSNGFL